MSFSKVLLTAVLGALAFSDCALAKSKTKPEKKPTHGRKVVKSSAKCSVIAIGFSEVSNKKAIAEASADASAYICGGDKVKSAESIAISTAEAFALAVAAASASCEAQGKTDFYVSASASATAQAKVWVAAYADAFASAKSCKKCKAYADSFGYVEKEVFLKAVASVDIKLKGYTNSSKKLVVEVSAYKEELKKVVAVAFAKALASAAALKNSDGCLAWANAGGCIYIPKDPYTKKPNCGGKNIAEFECEAQAVSAGAIEEIDAIAEASAEAASWTCGDSVAIAELEVTAKALAEATAVAISYAYASCKVDGGFACAFADTKIKETAYAVAYAYASIWAGAYTCKDTCTVEVDAVAEAVGSILVKAATSATAEVCSEGGVWTAEELEVQIVSASLCALAEASAIAISAGDSCLAGGIVYAKAKGTKCHK